MKIWRKKNCAAVSGASALPTFMFFNFFVLDGGALSTQLKFDP